MPPCVSVSSTTHPPQFSSGTRAQSSHSVHAPPSSLCGPLSSPPSLRSAVLVVGIYHEGISVVVGSIIFVLTYFIIFTRMSPQIDKAQFAQCAHTLFECAHFIFVRDYAQEIFIAILAIVNIYL